MTVGTSDDGGATVPTLVSDQIREIQADQGAIRKLATVMGVSQPVEVPIATTLPGAQYRVEGDAREDQTVPVTKTATLPGGALSSVISVSSFLANDSAWNVEAWITAAIGRAFGITEGESFLSGAGTNGERKGILVYTLAATAERVPHMGRLAKSHSVRRGGITSHLPPRAVGGAEPVDRKNAAFVMHPATYSFRLQRRRSTSGNYLLDGASFVSALVARACPCIST